MSDAELSATLAECPVCGYLLNRVVDPSACPECEHPVPLAGLEGER